MSEPHREVELKARVVDLDDARKRIEQAGAVLVFDGSLHDRIYDFAAGALGAKGLVLRLRTYRSPHGAVNAQLDWKGPTLKEGGYKIRAELTTGVTDPDAMASILARSGFEVVSEIDREISQYEISARAGDVQSVVIIRFEQYPRMDTLVEVEGAPTAIEQAIDALEIPRDRFSADRLTDFVQAFEARTGQRGAVSKKALGVS
ncbi:MAG: class IV adenylate cyclase [Gemmatimonadaceae bacterium]